jgi:hypothetical protein
MINKIKILASLFSLLSIKKEAGFADDLAVRIMHSLVPSATDALEAPYAQAKLTKTSLLPVAERYIESSCRIIADEMKHSKQARKYYWGEAEKSFLNKDYGKLLSLAIEDFSNPSNWDVAFGGIPWTNYSKMVLKLYESVVEFKNAIKENNIDKIKSMSGEIAAYMNVLDGMNHNTGSFISKIIDYETEREMVLDEGKEELEDIPWSQRIEERQKKINELMDAKQLSDTEDVLLFLKPYMKENPDLYLYKEYFSDLASKGKPDIQRSLTSLKKIREGKLKLQKHKMMFDELYNTLSSHISKGTAVSSEFIVMINNLAHPSYGYCKELAGEIKSELNKIEQKLEENLLDVLRSYNFLPNQLTPRNTVIINVFSDYNHWYGEYGTYEYDIEDKTIEKVRENSADRDGITFEILDFYYDYNQDIMKLIKDLDLKARQIKDVPQ